MIENKSNFICGLMLASPLFSLFAASNKRPNVLVIMSDDHAAEAIGVYGSRFTTLNPTPNIDKLAKEGIIMDNVFSTNSISAPSRACVISGLYSQNNGVMSLGESMDISKQNLPLEMDKLGYETAIVGKWHLGNAPEKFSYYNIFHGWGSYFDPILFEKGVQDSVMTFEHGRNVKVWGKQYSGHSTDILTDISLDWLKNKRDDNKPFMLCVHYRAPHDNFDYAPRYEHYLDDVFMPEPASLWDNKNNGSVATKGKKNILTHLIGTSIGKRNPFRNQGIHMGVSQELNDHDYKRAAYQEYMKKYFRCIKGIDDNVERIVDYLKSEKLLENTIVVYTSDQGMMLGEHDYMDKRWMYDESERIPFIVRYPKSIKKGIRSDAMISNVDIPETIIDMAGGEVPSYMQGRSFKSILFSGKEPIDWPKSVYYRYWMHMAAHYNPAHFGIRTKDYKLIFYYGKEYKDLGSFRPFVSLQTPVAWEFYDLRVDPKEMNNCYGDKKYEKVIKELKSELKVLREKYQETDKNYPDLEKIIKSNWN